MTDPAAVASAIAAKLTSKGIRAKVWTGGKHTRVYLGIGKGDAGYVEVAEDGTRNYGMVDRRKASVRDWSEEALAAVGLVALT